jgi:hypothetical protein
MTARSDVVMCRLITQRGRPLGWLSIAATPTRLTTDSAMTTISVRMLFGSPMRDSSAASSGEARLIRAPVSTK